MLNIPVYLRGTTYYLHLRVQGKQVKKSLKTGDRKTAMLIAATYLTDLLPMTIRKYEIDIGRGVFKSDGEDDHKRMQEAIYSLENVGAFAPKQVSTTQPPLKAPGLRLQQLAEKFFELRKNLKPATALAYKTTAIRFSGFIGNPVISQIDRSDVTRYQEDLAKYNGVRTIDNKIGVLSSLFNFSIKQGYYFGENPAMGRQLLSNKDKAANGFVIFELDEIKAVFNPIALKRWRQTDPDFYFSTMLALISGCRISEITSLEVNQIRSNPVPHIKITASKTVAGIRDVPIPQTFFDELLAFIPKSGPVFKYTLRLGKGSGNAVSQKFNRHLIETKTKRPKLVFHSLRKFLNNLCLENDIQIEARCQLFGHELESVNVQTYTKKIQIEKMAAIFSPIQTKLLTTINYKVEEE